MTKALKNHMSNCSEMLNAIQERKRCNRLVIIPRRNTIPFQELIGDHFGVDVKRNGDNFGVDLGIISGFGIISGAVQVFNLRLKLSVEIEFLMYSDRLFQR